MKLDKVSLFDHIFHVHKNTNMFKCKAEFIAVQIAAMTRKGSTFFVLCLITE